jgi:hypothetical protein
MEFIFHVVFNWFTAPDVGAQYTATIMSIPIIIYQSSSRAYAGKQTLLCAQNKPPNQVYFQLQAF